MERQLLLADPAASRHGSVTDVHPAWGVVGGGDICDPVRIRDYPTDCYSMVLSDEQQRLDGDVVLQGPVRPVDVQLSGEVRLDAEPAGIR